MSETRPVVTKTMIPLAAAAVLIAAAGCSHRPFAIGDRPGAAVVTAIFTSEPVTLDGRLDDPVWREATVYSLQIPIDRQKDGAQATPHEPGTVRFAWDDQYLYAAFEFTDRDVVQEADADQGHHYRTGDVAELFLKPEGASHYWELYATPTGRKTAAFFPGRGRLGLASAFEHESDLKVAASVDGTAGDWSDQDTGWTAEMAVPRSELADAGIPLGPDQAWIVLAARYNYGVHLPTSGAELSSYPELSRTSFHLHEEYATLRLIRGEPRR